MTPTDRPDDPLGFFARRFLKVVAERDEALARETALQQRIDAALAWAREANPDPVRNGDLFADLRAALVAESFGVQPSREGD